jgi:SAM-dependent methyltransferase
MSQHFFRLQHQSRQRKFALFMKLLQPTARDLVLDCGGGDSSYFEALYPWPERIVVLDIALANLRQPGASTPVCGNGLRLPFHNHTFDIVWSNAVIEHVGDLNRQRQFASEIRRVGRAYFITTPWKGFPIELHYKLPLYQFVPKATQRYLSRRYAIGWYPKGQWEDINLLWQRQLQMLFPNARVFKHQITPWPETLIAYWTPHGGCNAWSAKGYASPTPLNKRLWSLSVRDQRICPPHSSMVHWAAL